MELSSNNVCDESCEVEIIPLPEEKKRGAMEDLSSNLGVPKKKLKVKNDSESDSETIDETSPKMESEVKKHSSSMDPEVEKHSSAEKDSSSAEEESSDEEESSVEEEENHDEFGFGKMSLHEIGLRIGVERTREQCCYPVVGNYPSWAGLGYSSSDED